MENRCSYIQFFTTKNNNNDLKLKSLADGQFHIFSGSDQEQFTKMDFFFTWLAVLWGCIKEGKPLLTVGTN